MTDQNQESLNADDYKYIDAWHTLSGSLPYYIKNLQERAAEEGAPVDSIYRRQDGSWATIRDVRNWRVKADVEAYVKEKLS